MNQDFKDRDSDNVQAEATASKLTDRKNSKKISFEEQRSHLPVDIDEEKNKAQNVKKLQVHDHLKFSDHAEAEHQEKKPTQHGNRYQARFKVPDNKTDFWNTEYQPEASVYEPQYTEQLPAEFNPEYTVEDRSVNEQSLQPADGTIEDKNKTSSRNKRAVKREIKRRTELSSSGSKHNISGSHLMQTRNRLQFNEEKAVKDVNVRKKALQHKTRYQISFSPEQKNHELNPSKNLQEEAAYKKQRYFDDKLQSGQIPNSQSEYHSLQSSESKDISVKSENPVRLKYEKSEIPISERIKYKKQSDADSKITDHSVVLVYKCGQEKLNNLYYQVKE